jgi:putative membrane protein
MEPYFLIKSIISGIAVLLTSKIVPGFEIRGFFTAVFTAILIAIMNFLLWWFIFIVTFPLTVLTLGLFTLVVNAIILKMAAAVMPGFELKSWLSAIFGGVVLAILNVVLHYILI